MTPRTPRARIVIGGGRYTDPWHDFVSTGAAIRELVAGTGCTVELRADVDAALADLEGVDLLVIDIGRPSSSDCDADRRVRAGLLPYLRSGSPLLVLHVSATSLPGIPEWEDVLGGIWVRGTTMHPEQGVRRVEILRRFDDAAAPRHADFDLDDEFYTFLRVHESVEVIARYRFDGSEQPLVWSHDYAGARVVYSALGHDAASLSAEPHRALLAAAVRWLLAAAELSR